MILHNFSVDDLMKSLIYYKAIKLYIKVIYFVEKFTGETDEKSQYSETEDEIGTLDLLETYDITFYLAALVSCFLANTAAT